jgi:hypothetical protein
LAGAAQKEKTELALGLWMNFFTFAALIKSNILWQLQQIFATD